MPRARNRATSRPAQPAAVVGTRTSPFSRHVAINMPPAISRVCCRINKATAGTSELP